MVTWLSPAQDSIGDDARMLQAIHCCKKNVPGIFSAAGFPARLKTPPAAAAHVNVVLTSHGFIHTYMPWNVHGISKRTGPMTARIRHA
jgi:hypothetical protein